MRGRSIDLCGPQALDRARTPPAAMRGGPYAAIALAVVSVSFSAIFISWSTSPFITIALYRLALASLILAPFALLDRRRPMRGILRKDALVMIGVGAILAYACVVYVCATGVLFLYTLGLRESLLPVGTGGRNSPCSLPWP